MSWHRRPHDLIQTMDEDGNLTKFIYDPNSNLTSVTDANGGVTSYSYDPMNRKASRTDPLHAIETYGYDGNGNLTGHTDRRGKVTVYQYDGINRRKFAGFGYTGSSYESTSTYTFDLGDRITQIVDSIAGTTMRQYDGLDDLTDEQTAQGEVGYLYDNARRRQTMTVVGQPTVSYGWDNANRLTGITQGDHLGTLRLRQRQPQEHADAAQRHPADVYLRQRLAGDGDDLDAGGQSGGRP